MTANSTSRDHGPGACSTRRWILIGVALVAIAVGIGVVLRPRPEAPAPADSGVSGLVLLGPLTPVEQLGGSPNERPYDAAVRIERAGSDAVVATSRSGADGRFRVDLAPGRYTLIARAPDGSTPPYAPPLDVTVVAHRFTDVTIRFDSGIR